MKNIKSAAVVIQNYIQYESFVNAIDAMLEKNIDVTILIPIEKQEKGFENMFDSLYEKLTKSTNYKIKRECRDDEYYDLLFMVAPVHCYLNLKRKYLIRYMYGYMSKPWYYAAPSVNRVFDIILTYGNAESFLKTYAPVYPIGNIKYLNFSKKESKRDKINLLYLPTYGGDTDIENIIPNLIKLKDRCNLAIKIHHGTDFVTTDFEDSRRKLIFETFDEIHTSEESLLTLLQDVDIVIADNESGSIWDSLCAGVPVVVSSYDFNNRRDYDGYLSEHHKAIEDGEIFAIDSTSNIETIIEKTLSKEVKEKQKKIFKRLFICENHETKNKFIEFLNDLDEGKIMSENEYIFQQIKKRYIEDFYDEIAKEKYNISLLEKEKEKIIEEYERFTIDIYNSTSWKITKPIRFIKNSITKIKKKR